MKEIKLTKLKETIYYDKLNNGLEIYMYINKNYNNYYASYNIKCGSIDTKFKVDNKIYEVENGTHHFLEHIKFYLNDGVANDYFDRVGTGINAYTTYDYTSYLIYGYNNLLEDINKLLDFTQEKCIREENIKDERQIIKAEEEQYKNDINQNIYNESMKALYISSNKKYLITGNQNNIDNITKKDLELIFDNCYNPNNSFLVICGNYNPYEVLALIKDNQNNKTFNNINVTKLNKKEDINISKKYIEIPSNLTIPKISINYKINKNKFKDINDITLDIIINILLENNFSNISNFYNFLINNNLIYDLNTSYIIDKDIIIITINITTKYIDEIINRVDDKINNLLIDDISLNRLIKSNISNLIVGFDNIEYINNYIINNIISYNKINNNIYDINKNISIDIIKRVIKHINSNNKTIIVAKAM